MAIAHSIFTSDGVFLLFLAAFDASFTVPVRIKKYGTNTEFDKNTEEIKFLKNILKCCYTVLHSATIYTSWGVQ